MGDGAVAALLKIENSSEAESFVDSFRSRNIESIRISKKDVLVAMDEMIYTDLKKMFPKNNIRMISSPNGIIDPSLLESDNPYLETAKAINSALKAPYLKK